MATNRKKGKSNKPTYRGKPRNNRSKQDDQGFKDENQLTKTENKSKNDVSWYTQYPELTLAAGSIPYTLKPGMRIFAGVEENDPFIVPGVLSIDWAPSIGVSGGVTSPASLIARELYSKVRDKFSGSLVADPPDFAIYLLCLDSIYSYIAWLKRVYRILVAYTPQNISYPDMLLYAMGFSQDSWNVLKRDRVLLWEHINELVSMTKRFKCPAEFPFITRHYWMNDRVFTDTNSIMGQIYLFNQTKYYKFTLLNTPDAVLAGGARLIDIDVNVGVDGLFTFGKELIEALSAWDECYDINGYLMRAYESTPSFEIDLLPQDSPLVPSFEPEVLSQIENLRTLGYESTVTGTSNPSYTADVTQDPKTNSILCTPVATLNSTNSYDPITAYGPKCMLNIHSDAPTVADTIIASRLQSVLEIIPDTERKQAIVHCGSEVVLKMEYAAGSGELRTKGSVCNVYFCNLTADHATNLYSNVRVMGFMSNFDWHPQMWLVSFTGEFQGCTPFMDVHNLGVVSTSQLKEMHRVCLISEWKAYSA